MAAEDLDLRLWKSKMAVGRMAYDSGLFTLAVQHFRKALSLIEERSLPSDLTSRTLVDLAKALGSAGQFEEGERLLKEAISSDEHNNVSLVEVIEDYHQLSLLYWRANRQELANEMVSKAWQMLKQHPKDVPDELTAKLLKHRAVLAGLADNFQKAEKLINEALEFIAGSPVLGKFSSIYGDSLAVKIMILIEVNRVEEAKELFAEALKVLDVTRGETHIKTLQMIEALNHLAHEKGMKEEEVLLQQELDRIKAMQKKKAAY